MVVSLARGWVLIALCLVVGCEDSNSSGDAGDAAGACRSSAIGEDVSVEADGRLVGTLLMPRGCGPDPLVVIYPGSGPTNRDGNDALSGLRTDSYRQIAELLAEHGVASLRYDKRGVGASASALRTDPAAFTFDDDVADGRLWAARFADDPRFDRLILAGHSEGALWAILLAQDSALGVDAVISLAGAGRPIGTVLRDQLADQSEMLGLTPQLLAEADRLIAQLEAGMRVDAASIPTQLASIFAAQNQAYLITWMSYDPALELADLTQPTLIVQGTTDFQVKVDDATILADAHAGADLLVIEGMCHVLKEARDDREFQVQSVYTDPTLPLHPVLETGLVDFLDSLE